MCGAIAFSLPTNYLSPAKKLAGILLYNAARITVYSLLGLIFGILGKQIFLGGFQKAFSIIAGVLILIIVIQSVFKRRFIHTRALDKLNYRIQNFIAVYIQKRQLYGVFLLGMANGLLPCGMVYLAITGALAAGSISGGIFFMASFGLGTFPAMFMLSYFGFIISVSARNTMKKAVPYFVAAMGVLLILRGMGLGMPHISPAILGSKNAISCHPR
jgi:sulfite exporter TauE/SafE